MDGKRWKGMSPNSKSTANSVIVWLWGAVGSEQVCCILLEMWRAALLTGLSFWSPAGMDEGGAGAKFYAEEPEVEGDRSWDLCRGEVIIGDLGNLKIWPL